MRAGHTVARGPHPRYPPRTEVPDDKVEWSTPWPDYAPIEFVTDKVLSESPDRKPKGWADRDEPPEAAVLKKRGSTDPTLVFWRSLGMLKEGSVNDAIREYEGIKQRGDLQLLGMEGPFGVGRLALRPPVPVGIGDASHSLPVPVDGARHVIDHHPLLNLVLPCACRCAAPRRASHCALLALLRIAASTLTSDALALPLSETLTAS